MRVLRCFALFLNYIVTKNSISIVRCGESSGEDIVRVEGDPSQILTQLSPLIHSTIVFIVIFTYIVVITIVNITIIHLRSDRSSPPSIHSTVMIIYVIIFLKVVITLLLKTQLYPSLLLIRTPAIV